MAQLKSSRATNSDFVGQTDDFFRELEQDIAEILGITLDVAISSPIFADISEDDGATSTPGSTVNADGSISGILRFLSGSTAAYAAAGIEFEAVGGARYKLCATSTDLELYEYNVGTETWDYIAAINTGVGSFIGLEDTPADWTAANPGDTIVVNSTKDGLEFSSAASVPVNLEDLDDVDPYVGNAGKFLSLTNEPTPTPVWSTVAPGSGVDNFVELGDVDGSFTVSASDPQALPEVNNIGTTASPSWKLAAIPPAYIYAAGHGVGGASGPYTGDQQMLLTGGWLRLYWQMPVVPQSYEIGNVSYDAIYNDGSGSQDIIKIPGGYPGLWMWDLQIQYHHGVLLNFAFAELTKETGGNNFQIPRAWGRLDPPNIYREDLPVPEWYYYTPNPPGTGFSRCNFWTRTYIQKDVGGGQESSFYIKVKLSEQGIQSAEMLNFSIIGYRLR